MNHRQTGLHVHSCTYTKFSQPLAFLWFGEVVCLSNLITVLTYKTKHCALKTVSIALQLASLKKSLWGIGVPPTSIQKEGNFTKCLYIMRSFFPSPSLFSLCVPCLRMGFSPFPLEVQWSSMGAFRGASPWPKHHIVGTHWGHWGYCGVPAIRLAMWFKVQSILTAKHCFYGEKNQPGKPQDHWIGFWSLNHNVSLSHILHYYFIVVLPY